MKMRARLMTTTARRGWFWAAGHDGTQTTWGLT
jgi:hypothetical protein